MMENPGQEWIARALNAEDATARAKSLQQWTADYLLEGLDERAPFATAVRTLPPNILAVVEQNERSYRARGGCDNNGRREFFGSLDAKEIGAFALAMLKLQKIAERVGLGAWNIPARKRSWFREYAHVVLISCGWHDLSFTRAQFLECVHILHHDLTHLPGPTESMDSQPPWFTIQDAVFWRLIGSRAPNDIEFVRDWLAHLVPLFDRAAEKYEAWTHNVLSLARTQRALLAALGEPNRPSRAAMLAQRAQAKIDADKRAREERYARHDAELARQEAERAKQAAMPPKECKRKLLRRMRPAILAHVSPLPIPPPSTPSHVSYFGGPCFLPEQLPWPTHEANGKAFDQAFVGQIALDQLPPIASNPLPRTGYLIFFSYSVAHVDGPLAQAPRTLPAQIGELGYSPDWLAKDDPLRRVDFCYPVQFAPLDTYPDSETREGVVGWKFNTPYEAAYTELAREASARATTTISGEGPPLPPSRDHGALRDLHGGPYVVTDARLVLHGLRAGLKRSLEITDVGYFSSARLLGPDAAALFDSIEVFVERMSAQLADLDDWARMDPSLRGTFRDDLAAFDEPLRGLHQLARRSEAARKEEWLNLPPEARLAGFEERRYVLPYSLSDFVSLRDFVVFNLKRCIHLGLDVDRLYPPEALALLPERDPDVVDVDRANRHGAPCFHQMLGWGRSVQSAPTQHADKVMLLQLFGGRFRWLTNSACVIQYWIRPEDLRRRRFDRGFTTVECN